MEYWVVDVGDGFENSYLCLVTSEEEASKISNHHGEAMAYKFSIPIYNSFEEYLEAEKKENIRKALRKLTPCEREALGFSAAYSE